ncbi:MAG: hypothetical protein ACRDGH_16530 [Candidatus Limnocylindria bacterium]
MSMTDLLWLIIALPLGGAVVLAFLGRRMGEPVAGWLASAAISGSFLIALAAALPFVAGGEHGTTVMLWELMPSVGAAM